MKVSYTLEELNTPDITLADFLRTQEIRLMLPCGGCGRCGQCTVGITYQGAGELAHTQVLSCQTGLNEIISRVPYGTERIIFDIDDSKLIETRTPAGGVHTVTGGRKWGAAVDLGSTTIETAAVSVDGSVIGSVRGINPQVSYGSDVLSRIRAASEGKIASSDMQRLAESTIQGQLQELSDRYGLCRFPEVMAIAGNTTMGHLLTGKDVRPLGEAPFNPGDISLQDISGVFFEEHIPVYLLPGISAFVGGDIVSGILSLDMDLAGSSSLLVDLGTNAEMVIGNRDRFLVTSAAAGPAFEGAGLSCGCPGVPGAIRGVTFNGLRAHLSLIPWDSDLSALPPGKRMQEEMRLKTRRPAGLCGSGLISAISGMKKAAVIDDSGTFTRDEWIKNGFLLWRPSVVSPDVSDIRLTQDDIHALLMAKAAIRSGIEILLEESGIVPESVFLSGGFGSSLSVADAESIGLFPASLRGRIRACGNTSLAGAVKFISHLSSAPSRLIHICSVSDEIRLADFPGFEEKYLSHLSLS